MSIKELALRRLEADGRAFLAAARRDPSAPVPSCPGWNLDKLVGHVGRVHTWAAQVVRSRTAEPISSRLFPAGPDDPTLRLEWARERHAELLDALRGLGEDEPIWVFRPNGPGTGRFWLRRQAHELALHRWDAEQALGAPQPLDGELAADGIDELLAAFLPNMAKSAAHVSRDGATMHVHCTDRDGEWLVRFTPDGPVTTAEHTKADVAVRGPAADLYLCLWNRVSRDRVEVFGDASLLDRWAEHVRI
jgi:uncharacterized protein (TIGR03083 family)